MRSIAQYFCTSSGVGGRMSEASAPWRSGCALSGHAPHPQLTEGGEQHRAAVVALVGAERGDARLLRDAAREGEQGVCRRRPG